MGTLNFKTTLMVTGLATAIMSGTFLTGCSGSSKEANAAIAGSVIGGIAGRQFGKGKGKTTMTILGAVVGGMIGGNIGRGMDEEDRRRAAQTLESTPNYQKVAWENPNTNTQYEMTPVNQYEAQVSGKPTQCRDYIMDAWIDGRMQQVKGRACKDSNGQWVNAS